MPIDARIPLGVTPPDPNGFVNALAAGMKMRELQNAGDRAAYKDELAVRKSNALSKFYQSPRGSEDIATLAQEAPDAVGAAEKSSREAQLAGIQAKQHQANWAKANYQLLADASGAVLANPTRENANNVLKGLEAQGGDMTVAREQLRTSPDEQISNLAKGWAGNAQKVQEMALADKKAAEPKWNSYTGKWESRPAAPGSASTPPATGAGPEAVVPPGTVVPGGELPPPGDIDAAVLHRAGQGPEPAGNVDYEGLSDEGLAELQRTSTFQKGQKPGAPSPGASTPPTSPSAVPPAPPVDGQPVTAQPTPVVYGSPSERDAAQAQRQGLRDAAADQRYTAQQEATDRRLDIAEQRQAAADKKAQYANEVASGQRLTPADASKARQKLIRIEDAKRQIALVRATWEGTKDAQGKQVTKGIKGTMGAGPLANVYAPDLLYEAGEKFNTAVESLAASKTALLRVPGIGSQSDLEQALERMDLPSRNTNEGTTEQEIKAYEDLITNWETGLRAALAGPAEAPAEPGPAAPVQVTPQSEQPSPKPVKVAPLEDLADMPMPGGKYAGKWARDPSSGIVYRSDGTNWNKWTPQAGRQ